MNSKNSILKAAVRFKIWSKIFGIPLENDSNRYLLTITDAKPSTWALRALLLLTQFNSDSALYQLTDWHCVCSMTVLNKSCVIMHKINCIRYLYLDFLLEIYLHIDVFSWKICIKYLFWTFCWKYIYIFIYFHERFDLKFDLGRFGFEEKWEFEICLHDLYQFFNFQGFEIRFDICPSLRHWFDTVG